MYEYTIRSEKLSDTSGYYKGAFKRKRNCKVCGKIIITATPNKKVCGVGPLNPCRIEWKKIRELEKISRLIEIYFRSEAENANN